MGYTPARHLPVRRINSYGCFFEDNLLLDGPVLHVPTSARACTTCSNFSKGLFWLPPGSAVPPEPPRGTLAKRPGPTLRHRGQLLFTPLLQPIPVPPVSQAQRDVLMQPAHLEIIWIPAHVAEDCPPRTYHKGNRT